ncbi:UDP-N-acetylglucosamine--LPS N-acetylglucosamine transferase [Caloramator sp. E03]|uniref:MGDG synthase family glycosyltransferase n=1 Tax=Caloramator sp. E03 TaxID=2576307 RepID=UPI00110FFE7D|nr:glycosyltransferase [Caloramator sp. E03]QCX33411.1 UDP-N-acetylglucosamine--LPS N-acetylglucosamine transferase [Caloramator sp. E03]
MKVLALSVSAGTGHFKAAKAIKNYFESNYKNVEMNIIDTLKYINPLINKIVIGSYLKSIKVTPKIYAKLYEHADEDETISSFSEIANHILSIKIKNLILDTNPDIILCTHPFPLEMVSILKRKGKISIPAVGVLTDYAIHSFWFYECIDGYIIPNEDFIDEAVEKGAEIDTLYPLGIPVEQKFLISIDKNKAKQQLGFDINKPSILLMGGSLGIGNIKKIYETLSSSPLDIQIIVCTGRNYRLKEKIEDIHRFTQKKSLILSYTENINTIMCATDILITKPGGLTIAESLVKGLPIIINSTIPGHEEKNANYLINSGIAATIKDSKDITCVVRQLIKNKSRLEQMSKMAFEKAKPTAAKDICELLIEKAKK